MIVAAFDVGGMSIKRGVVRWSSNGQPTVELLDAVPIDSTADADDLLRQFRGAIDPVIRRSDQCCGIAFPGPMDYSRGVPLLRGQRKFDALHGVDLRAWATSTWPGLQLDLRFVNDAEAAALGEHAAGAGQGGARSLMVTLGTGFGAAALVDGAAVPQLGGVDVAALFGRTVEEHGIADDVLSAVGLARLLGVPPSDLERVAGAARRGDAGASDTFATFGARLGDFLRDVTAAMDLDVVVIGGGGAHTFDLFGEALAVRMPVEVRSAVLGPSAALVGAATPWRRALADD